MRAGVPVVHVDRVRVEQVCVRGVRVVVQSASCLLMGECRVVCVYMHMCVFGVCMCGWVLCSVQVWHMYACSSTCTVLCVCVCLFVLYLVQV